MTKINSVEMRQTIINVCNIRPEAANDDMLLVAMIWYVEGWRDPFLYQKLRGHTNMTTILRTRRKLAEEGKIKVDPAVRALRQKEARATKAAIKKQNKWYNEGMKECKSVKVSVQAYNQAIKLRDENPDKYKGRGLVGVFDDLLLHRFTTSGRGSSPKIKKKS